MRGGQSVWGKGVVQIPCGNPSLTRRVLGDMNKLLLTAAFLTLPLAAAQTTAPVSAAAPAKPAAPARLLLTAPVGTAAEYVMTTRVSMKMSTPTVEALPGGKVSQAELDQIRQAMQAGGTQAIPVQTVTSKVFYRVMARDAAGKTTLLNAVVLPAMDGKKANTIRTTQTVDADGKTELLKVESDDPQTQAALAAVKGEMLKLVQQQNDQQPSVQYGALLVVGKTDTRTVSMNMQNLLGGLLGAMGSGPGGEQLIQKVQSSPLAATIATTYTGLNPQGLHSFTTTMSYQPWQVRIEGKGDMPTMQIEVLSGKTSGTQLYRPDGLPSSSDMNISMKMNMTTEMQGVRVRLGMDMTQQIQMVLKQSQVVK